MSRPRPWLALLHLCFKTLLVSGVNCRPRPQAGPGLGLLLLTASLWLCPPSLSLAAYWDLIFRDADLPHNLAFIFLTGLVYPLRTTSLAMHLP